MSSGKLFGQPPPLTEVDCDLDDIALAQYESQDDAVKQAEHLSSLAQQVWERRGRPRLHQQDKGVRSLFRGEINYLVALVESSWRGRSALIVSFVLSVALLYWSLMVRKDLIQEHSRLTQELDVQQAELDHLLERWSKGELRTLKERVSSAESRVFADYQKLAVWLSQQALIASQLNLQMRYNLLQTMPTQIKNVGEVPITIMVSPSNEQARHSYLRMLEFIHGMVNDQWHLEMVSTQVQSNGEGVNDMSVVIHVWVHDENIVSIKK